MRGIGWLASTTALLAGVAFSSQASADSMDPALNRLVTSTNCFTTGPGGTGRYYNPKSAFTPCGHDDAAFAKLIAQYGFAIAATAMHSARTTGYGGFEIALEASYTKIDSGADYWKNGTEGAQDPVSKRFPTSNASPDSMLQIYTLKIRKGFPFGVEVSGDVGYLVHTNIVSGGADIRWSLFEGFRTGIPAIFPELAVGGSVRTITGTQQFQLTVVGVDGQISKPIPIAGTLVITPYVGYQWIRIFGDSGLIDMTPNTDAVAACGYQGNNSPATPDPTKKTFDGQAVCSHGAGASADFNNTTVFSPVRLTRHRLNFGLQWRFQMVKFGAHFITDLVGVSDANSGANYSIKTVHPDGSTTTANKFDGVDKQWTLAFDLGAVF